MTTVSQVTEAIYRSRYDDQMSAGAAAATKAIQSNTAAIEVNEQAVTRATRSQGSLAKAYDPVTRETAKLDKVTRDLTQAKALQAAGDAKTLPQQEQIARTVAELTTRVERQAAAVVAANRVMATAGTVSTTAGTGFASFGSQIQNASFQVGDFAVQVASGQSAVTALAQQLPQLLGGFGIAGAVAGAAVAIGAVVYRMVEGKSAAEQFSDAIDAQAASYKSAEEAAKIRREGLTAEAQAIVDLTGYYRTLTAEQRRGELAALEQQRKNLEQTGLTASQGIGSGLRASTSGSLFSSLFGAPAPTDSMREAVAQLNSLDDPLNRTRENIRGVIGELQALANGESYLGREIAAARDELIKAAPELEKNGTAARQLYEQIRAAGGSAPQAAEAVKALGDNAAASARGVGELAEQIRRANAAMAQLRREAADNPYADVDRETATLTAQVRAIERGSLAQAEDIERRDQRRNQNLDARNKLLDEEAKNLRALGATEDDVAQARELSEARIGRQQVANDRLRDSVRTGTEALKEREAQDKRNAASADRSAEALARQAAQMDRLYATPEMRNGILLLGPNDDAAMKAIRASGIEQITDRTNAEAAKSAKATNDEIERDNKRTTDDIVRYGAERFADLWSDTGGGFAGLMKSFEQMAKSTFARIAAEAIIRPIIQPIVASLLGGSGTAAGGSSGILGSLGLGNISSLLGLGNSTGLGSSLGLGNIGSSVSGLMGTTLWSGNGAMSVSELLAAGPATGASLGPSAAGVTLGGALGGIGGGFSLGNLANSLVGGKSTGGMIGSGVGATAGFLVGGPVGGLIGGTAGGLIGGLFGAGKQHPAGHADIQIDDSGNLAVAGTGAKGMDITADVAATTASLAAINATLKSLDLTLTKDGPGAFTNVHYGDDATAADAENLKNGILAAIQSDDKNVATAIAADIAKGVNVSLEQALADISWVKNIYTPLVENTEPVSAFQQQLDALGDAMDANKTKATDLGLATEGLSTAYDRQVTDLMSDRQTTLWDAERGLAVRQLTAANDNKGAAEQALDVAQEQERRAFEANLKALGVQGEDFAHQMLQLDKTLAAERLAVQDQFTQQALQTELSALQRLQSDSDTLTGVLNRIDTGAGVSPQNAFVAAQTQFNDVITRARSSGDVSAVGGAADALLAANSAYNATGSAASTVESMLRSTVKSLGIDLDLPGFTDNFQAGVDRLIAAQETSNAKLIEEIAALREELRTTRMLDAA